MEYCVPGTATGPEDTAMKIQPSISLSSPSSGNMAADGSWHIALHHTTSASEWPETCSLCQIQNVQEGLHLIKLV